MEKSEKPQQVDSSSEENAYPEEHVDLNSNVSAK